MSERLSSNPVIVKKRKRDNGSCGHADSKLLKKAEQLVNKLKNLKNAARLVTCEFDQQLLQFPGLLGALTPKLESGWQSATMTGPDYDQLVRDSWPLMIQPFIPGIHGPQGAVPLSHSFTWTRFIPRIEDSVPPDDISSTTCSERPIVLEPFAEPEVVLLFNTDQVKSLCKIPAPNRSNEISSLAAFGAQLRNLNRPVTCIFLTCAKFRASNKRRSSIGPNSNPSRLSINRLCVCLQLDWGVKATRICSTVQDVAQVLSCYTRSIAERPYKEGRLEHDSGLAFLPDTVRMGLTGCASRGRGAGPAPGSALINTDPDQTERAAHAWANQIWLAQLGQWRGLTGEIAHSITLSFPTARAFYRDLLQHQSHTDQSGSSSDSHPFEAPLSNLEIRRGAGILASRRRLGPEFARRLITHFVSENPNHVIE